jgi:hypothetical protein
MHGELVAALLAYRATRKGKDGKERSVLVNTSQRFDLPAACFVLSEA